MNIYNLKSTKKNSPLSDMQGTIEYIDVQA